MDHGSKRIWMRTVFLIGVLLAGRLTVMAFLSIFDSSEARYAVLGKNMAESGDFVVPRFVYDGVFQSFDGKPPLLFQLCGLSVRFLGSSAFAVRLPSFIASFLVLGLLFFTVRRLAGEKQAFTALLICLSSVVFYLFSGFCMTDMLLTLAVSGAVMTYMLFESAETPRFRKAASLACFAFLGLGMLTKGPVALVLAGLPIGAYVIINRRWRGLRDHAWLLGMVLFFAITTPWFIVMQRQNPGFLYYFFINENFFRYLFAEYGDRYGSGREAFRGVSIL